MIPAPFEYHRPRSLDEAIGLLAQHGEDARIVAGGHSLIPMMKLRLAKPEHLVDLQDLDELREGAAKLDRFLAAPAADHVPCRQRLLDR